MAVDGFELAYDRAGSGPAVVLLHGWPGDRTDYRDLVPLLSGCEVVVPDLRGFGHSDKHVADPVEQYSGRPGAERRGPDHLARHRTGARRRLRHRGPDGRPWPGPARTWSAPWSSARRCQEWGPVSSGQGRCASSGTSRPPAATVGPAHRRQSGGGPRLSAALLGALVWANSPSPTRTSTTWSPSTGRPGLSRPRCSGTGRARGPPRPPRTRPSRTRGPAPTPAVVLWPEYDPLFPREWSDRIDSFFSQARLRFVDGVGHYAPPWIAPL